MSVLIFNLDIIQRVVVLTKVKENPTNITKQGMSYISDNIDFTLMYISGFLAELRISEFMVPFSLNPLHI